MSCRAEDIQKVAAFLSLSTNSGNKEAFLRSAVSRAYYAAFHAALSYAPAEIQAMRGGKKHEVLIQWMRKHSHEKIREMGLDLNDMRLARTRADYQIDRHINPDVMFSAYQESMRFINELHEIMDTKTA
jgi:uncharacterized protein (UPF0332 family)